MGAVQKAVRLTRDHPGAAASPVRFLWRLAVWRVRTAFGRDATVVFPRYNVRFWCPAEWRGMSKMAFALRDSYEPELAGLARWVLPGSTVVDVGAHYGVYSLALASLVGEHGHVVAVEPDPHALRVLRFQLELNRFNNVEVIEAGLGDANGTGTLHLHPDPSRASLIPLPEDGVGDETIRIARLDDLVPPERRVTFMKVDVEGFELAVFRGARRVLRRDRPVVLFEFLPPAAKNEAPSRLEAWELLREDGYTIFEFLPTGELIRRFDPRQVTAANLVAIPT